MKKMMVLTLIVVPALFLAACSGVNTADNPVSGDILTPLADYGSFSEADDNPVAAVPEDEIIAEAEEGIIADEPEEEDESIYNYAVAAGDIIEFGGYEWRVLDLKGGKALIISENIVGRREYHSAAKRITWAGCTLRQYLNEDFYNSFTEEEQARIAETQITTPYNPWFGIPGGDTVDKIFLLSLQELVKYFGDSGKLGGGYYGESFLDDEYNSARIAYDKNGNASMWWLRSVGQYAWDATEVFATGIIDPSGIIIITDEEGGIRPALWLDMI